MKTVFSPLSKYLFFPFFVFHLGVLNANIDFDYIGLHQALEKAQLEKKLIFVDTYATWCAPCKVMDRVFEKASVSNFFNDNFINIKIDMDGKHGSEIVNQYEVVWLPTLLILNHQGEILTKIDRLVTADELVALANEALGGSIIQNNISSLNSNPFSTTSGSSGSDYDPSSKEEVIYVHDTRESSGRPHIMYHEAYLHLQLMDSKHQKVVKKYLSTQKDWSSEKNIKFIFDFLQNVNSTEFRYFVANKARFQEVIGEEKVERSLSMLINNRLEQGFPRPTLSEAEDLYQYISPQNAKIRAYQYYLRMQITDGRQLEFINVADQYIRDINPYDHEVIYQLVTSRLNRSDYKSYLSHNLELMLLANSLEDDNPDYLYTLARLHFHLGQKEEALDAVSTSLQIGRKLNRSLDLYQKLQKQIEAL